MSSANTNHSPVSETSCASFIKSEFIADLVIKEEIGVSLDRDEAEETYCPGLFIKLDRNWSDGISHFRSANVKTKQETSSSHSNAVSHQEDFALAGEPNKIDGNTETEIQEPDQLSSIFPVNLAQQCDAAKEDDASLLKDLKFEPDFEECEDDENFDKNIPASFYDIEPTCSRAYRENLGESQHFDAIVQDNASLLQLIGCDPNVRDDINYEYLDTGVNASFGDGKPSNSEAHKENLHKYHQPPKVGQNQNQVILKELRVVLKDLYPKKLNAGSLEQTDVRCGNIYGSKKSKDLFKGEHKNDSSFKYVVESNSKHRLISPDCSTTFNDSFKYFSCPHCPLRFKFRSKYKLHLIKHSDARLHKCPECEAKFKYRGSMQAHLKSHAGQILTCAHCPRQFDRKRSLIVHLRAHEDRPYACTVCALKFRHDLDLKTHLERVHSDKFLFFSKPYPTGLKKKNTSKCRVVDNATERLFSCDLCLKKFWSKNSLRKHMMIHLDQSPVKRSHCSVSLVNTSMGYRVKRHANEMSFCCAQSPAQCIQKQVLKSHSVRHPDDKPCSSTKCKSDSTLILHCKLHSIEKSQCSRMESPAYLFHHNPLFQSSERDVSMDVDENKFTCDKCKAEFDDKVDESILCEGGCYSRFHLQCAGLSENEFEMIVRLAGKVIWICKTCETHRTTEVMGLQKEKTEVMTKLESVPVEKEKLSSEKEELRIFSEKLTMYIESLRNEKSKAYKEAKNANLKTDRLFSVKMEVNADSMNVKVEAERLQAEKMKIEENLEKVKIQAEKLLREVSEVTANLENVKAEAERLLAEKMEIAENLEKLKEVKTELENVIAEKSGEISGIMGNKNLQQDCGKIREDTFLRAQPEKTNGIPKKLFQRERVPVMWLIGDNHEMFMKKMIRQEVRREGFNCKVRISGIRTAISWRNVISNSLQKGRIVNGDVIVYFAGRYEVGRKKYGVLVNGVERIVQMVGPRIKVIFMAITHRYDFPRYGEINRRIDFCNSEVQKRVTATSNGMYVNLSYLVREDFEANGKYLNESGKRQFVYSVVHQLKISRGDVTSDRTN